MTVLSFAHECLLLGNYELHHYRGKGKLPKPLDDIILASVIPCSKSDHDVAHLSKGKRWPFDQWLKKATRDELVAMIVAMDEQVSGIITRSDVKW
jgi:hypothetical protein